MKKKSIIAIIVVLFLLLGTILALGLDYVDTKSEEEKIEDTQEVSEKVEENIEENEDDGSEEEGKNIENSVGKNGQITVAGGLGDTLGVLKENHGEYEVYEGDAFFQGAHIVVKETTGKEGEMSDNDIVWKLSVNLQVIGEWYENLDDVLAIAEKFMPEDAERIDEDEYTVDEDMSVAVYTYKSDMLAERITDESLYNGEELGVFTLEIPGLSGDYFYFELTTGKPDSEY